MMTAIVNTYGRESIDECLEALTGSEFILEVIVVDQNEIPRVSYKGCRVHIHHFANKSISCARNFGARLASNEFLLFIDDDCILRASQVPAWVYEVDAVAGLIVEPNFEPYSRRHSLNDKTELNVFTSKALMGGLIFLKKDSFWRVGGFDPKLGVGSAGSGEDTDLCWKLLDLKLRVFFTKNLTGVHPPARTSISKNKAYNYGYGKGVLVRKWMKRNLSYAAVELFEMLTLNALRLIMFVVGFRSKKYLLYTIKGQLSGILKG